MAKPDWITLSKSSGSGNDTVTVTAAKNTSTSARSGSITVKSGSLSRVVTISQDGQSGFPLTWLTEPITFEDLKYFGQKVSALVSMENLNGAAVGNPINDLSGSIFSYNGEETGEEITLEEFGLSITAKIDTVTVNQNGSNSCSCTFYAEITNASAVKSYLNFDSEDDSGLKYSSIQFYINGVKGLDEVEVESGICELVIYEQATEQSLIGEITLSPEGVELDLEGSDSIQVNYDNIIPNSITIDDSEVDTDHITISPQNKPSGNEIASGSFELFIQVDSEVSTDITYSFDVSGMDESGETITTTGTIYIKA